MCAYAAAYGDSVSGRVVIPPASIDGCTAFEFNSSWGNAPIIMLPRGVCTFETKVFNAENAGAAAVLIADTLELCYDPNLSTTCQTECTGCRNGGYIDPTTGCECFLPYMAGALSLSPFVWLVRFPIPFR